MILNNLNKTKSKGVSPIITIVLIILVAVIIIASFSSWAKEDTQKKLQQAYEMIPSASQMECSRNNISVQSCYIDPYSNHIKLNLNNPSTLDYKGLTLSLQFSDSTNEEYKIVGAFEDNLEPGLVGDFKTYKNFYFLKQDKLFNSINVDDLELITLSSRTCPNKFIDISDCNVYSTINEDLVYWYPLDQENETLGLDLVINGDFSSWTDDDPDDWQVYEVDFTSSIEENNGGARIYSEGSANSLGQNILDVNKNYIYNLDVIEDNGGQILLEVENDYQKLRYFSSIGNYNGRFRAILGSVFKFKRSGSSDLTIDNVVVKEIQALDLINSLGVSLFGDFGYDDNPYGDVNSVMNFNGENTYIDLDLSENYPTQSFWFKTNSSSEQVLTAGISGDSYDSLTFVSSYLTMADDGGPSEKIRTVNTYETNTWYHVVVIKTDEAYPDTYKIYVNGVLQDIVEGGGNRSSGGSYISSRYYAGSRSLFFNGSMSDFRIYDKELNSKEIEELYLSTKSKYIIE